MATALRLLEGGCSNSRPTATSGSTGFDTVRVRYRGDDRSYSAAKGRRHAIVARGELRLLDVGEGVTAGVFPDGMAYVEGRVSAILAAGGVTDDDHRLASVEEVERCAEVGALVAGVDGAEVVAVGRADQASELRFSDGREGLAVLRMAASVDLPWLKASTDGSRRDGLETVSWRVVQGRSIVLRLYDKGRETGTAAPGEWLRLERQRRYRKSREVAVGSLRGLDLHATFVGRELRALVELDREHELVTRASAIESLRSMLRRGVISGRVCESLVGFLVCEGSGLPGRTVYRRWAELRRLGICLDSLDGDGRRLDLAGYVRAFADQWAVAA